MNCFEHWTNDLLKTSDYFRRRIRQQEIVETRFLYPLTSRSSHHTLSRVTAHVIGSRE